MNRFAADSLDYAFLRHIGYSAAGEAALHSFYLPFLADKTRVVDLGCGFGGFVQLLRTAGHDAVGVDSDPQCIAEARGQDLPVIEADVLDYLRQAEPESVDAIAAAHLVEHMPYAAVFELIRLAYRALAPSGKLLLITPNPRALVSHLELYPMHFGHVAMYHPQLLSFFMQQAGFEQIQLGENPATCTANVSADSPLRHLSDIYARSEDLAQQSTAVDIVLPRPRHRLRRLIWSAKMLVVRWLIQPYFDRTMADLQQVSHHLAQTITAMDRPFEAYALAVKPADNSLSTDQTGRREPRVIL